MKFVCYSDWSQLPDSANALFEQAARENLFYSRHWFENLTSSGLQAGEEMLLACVESGEVVLAILPLLKDTPRHWSTLKHRYTPHYSLLLSPGKQEQVLDCLARGLDQHELCGLTLEPVADNDPALTGLQQALEARGFHGEYLFRHYNWIYRVQGRDYAQYLAQRPARLRNTLERKRRKLAREQDYSIHLYRDAQVLPAMPDYYAAYSASWKAYEQFRNFVNTMLDGFSQQGWVRLGILRIEGQAVAGQLWFVHHGKASIFRLAYDEMWKRYSPGTILTAYMMEVVIDTDKVEEIDFLTGNDAYKQDWMSERRERFALSCVKKRAAKHWWYNLVQRLKQ